MTITFTSQVKKMAGRAESITQAEAIGSATGWKGHAWKRSLRAINTAVLISPTAAAPSSE